MGNYRKLVRQILVYLLKHPSAKDTVEGVSQWWMGGEPTTYRQDEIQEALSSLVARRILTKRETVQSKTLYSLNPEMMEEIHRFVEDKE